MDKYCCTDSQKSRSAHFRPLENSKSLGYGVSRSQSDTRTSDSTFTRTREVDAKEAATKIWIIGSSYIHRGEKAAHEIFGHNFGLNATVEWFGKGGMRWSGVLPRFYGELAKQTPPDILVVHAGGNDLGLTPPSKLASQMQRELMQLHKEFPSMTILFSCINERQMWRYGPPQNINNDRKMVNSLMRKAVGCFGGEVIEHPLLRFFNRKIFLPDGVHFTKEGNHIFLTSIHGALNKILQTSCPKRPHSKMCTFKKNAAAAVVQVPQEEVSRLQSDTRTSDSPLRKKTREVDKRDAAKKIWIIGSSYVHRGEKAAHKMFGQNFGLNATVEWFGKGGMRWSGVLPRFYGELAKQTPPDILVVHAGGNNLGLTPPSKLASQMQRELMQLHKEFPSMTILLSCINERQMWRYGPPQNINNDRKMVNSLMRKAVGCFGGEVIEHPLLRFFNRKIFLPDGVHFTDEGNHIFLSSIHGALNKILQASCPKGTLRVTVGQ